jgi:RNA polymerase sigma-70 factor (ECF subfamily)
MRAFDDVYVIPPAIESIRPDMTEPAPDLERLVAVSTGMPVELSRSRPAGLRSEPGDDRELLARVARGDRTAFTTLYAQYHPRLARFLQRLTSNSELISEIVNDTLFTVWCKAADFRGDSQVSTWILGVAYRRALLALRAAHRATPPGTSVPVEMVETELSGENQLAACEQREWIDRGLARLPLPQRIVIELAYFVGLSCEEIAVIVDSPVNTVKTRMFKARRRLRPMLEQLAGAATHADQSQSTAAGSTRQ